MSDSTTEPTGQPIGSEPPLPPEFSRTPLGSEPPLPPEFALQDVDAPPLPSDLSDEFATSAPVEPAPEPKSTGPRFQLARRVARPVALLVGAALMLFGLSMITTNLRAEGVDCGTAASPRAIQAEGLGIDGIYEQAIRQNACNNRVIDRRTYAGVIALVGLAGIVFALWRRKADDAGWKKVAAEGRGPDQYSRAHLDGVSRDRSYPPRQGGSGRH